MMGNKILYWAPRILGMLGIGFIVLFTTDCFEGSYDLKQQLTCFVMHNIPSLILIVILILAWKLELIGGIVFILAAIVMTYYWDGFGKNTGVLALTSPFLVIGVLFILNYITIHNKNKKHD
jgi:energy-coupling factor transporter transmembrane protein EcfT